MGQALYRKYRSKSLDEVVGQEHITTTLKNALKTGKISHAYLLTGPRGVGKTSVARILAFEVNGLPYDETKAHLDIIEIDAASNRRIDEIRDLRDKVNILPSSAKYKVYIIDEVHMLTREAFNALLKTLEEPPAHVIFILATTDAHKLPETIVSRTQHFSFKPIPSEAVIKHLRIIAKSENIDADDEALQLIAEHGGGSFRDSISLLDQARHVSGTLTREMVERLLGIAPSQSLDALQSGLEASDFAGIIQSLSDLRDQGFRPSMVAKQLSEQVRAKILGGTPVARDLQLLRSLVDVPASSQPEQALELALLDYALLGQVSVPTPPENIPTPRGISAAPTPPKTTPKPPEPKADQPETLAPKKPNKKEPVQDERTMPQGSGGFSIELWPVVLSVIKKQYNTLYGILRMADASFADDTLTLAFKFAFHQKRINDQKNKKLITDIILDQSGQSVSVVCLANSDSTGKAPKPSSSKTSSTVDTVSNIFGGAEVLES